MGADFNLSIWRGKTEFTLDELAACRFDRTARPTAGRSASPEERSLAALVDAFLVELKAAAYTQAEPDGMTELPYTLDRAAKLLEELLRRTAPAYADEAKKHLDAWQLFIGNLKHEGMLSDPEAARELRLKPKGRARVSGPFGETEKIVIGRDEAVRYFQARKRVYGEPMPKLIVGQETAGGVDASSAAGEIAGLAVDALAETPTHAKNVAQAVKAILTTAARRGRDMNGYAESTMHAKLSDLLKQLDATRPQKPSSSKVRKYVR